MKTEIKDALDKIQKAMDILERIEGKNEEVDSCCENLGFVYADLEHELSNL